MAISMLKIRRPLGRLIFNMGIAIPGKTVFLIETAPRALVTTVLNKNDHQAVKYSKMIKVSQMICLCVHLHINVSRYMNV